MAREHREGYRVASSRDAATAGREALGAAVDALAAVDLDALTPRELLEHTAALQPLLDRVAAQRSRALAEVDRREAYRQDACVTTASWWRLRVRHDPRPAATVVTTSRRLRSLDATRQALEEGRIGHAHAEVIARAATPRRRDAILAHEETLVRLAERATPRDVARACRRIAELVDDDGPAGAGPDPRRTFQLAQTVDGLWDVRGLLDAVTGARLDGLLRAHDVPDPSGTPEGDRRTPTQRRHDALDRVLRAAEEHPDASSVHGSKPRLLLTVDLLTLLGRPDLATRTTRLSTGQELTLHRALELLEGASLTAVLMLGPFRVVGLGRTHRVLPAWLRTVLGMVHGSCRGPGCDRPMAWTEAAHLDAWGDEGETDLDRTIPACRAHHDLMDLAGWTVHLDPDTARCLWTSPDGRRSIRTDPPEP